MIIAVDIDDTIASLAENWIGLYNKDHQDNLTKRKITDWDIGSFTRIGRKFYDYLLDPDLYQNVRPIKGSLKGIRYLKSLGFRIVYVTAGDVTGSKFNWLRVHQFEDNINNFVISYDKSLIRADYAIDDKPDNLEFYGDKGLLISQPWNESCEHPNRVKNWKEIIEWFDKEVG